MVSNETTQQQSSFLFQCETGCLCNKKMRFVVLCLQMCCRHDMAAEFPVWHQQQLGSRSHTKHYRQVCSGHHWLEESYRMSARVCDTRRLLAGEKRLWQLRIAHHKCILALLQSPSPGGLWHGTTRNGKGHNWNSKGIKVVCIPLLVSYILEG